MIAIFPSGWFETFGGGGRYILPLCQSCSQLPQRYSPPKSLKLKVKGIYRQSATSIWKGVNRIWAGPWARSGIVWRPTLGLPSRPCLLLYLSSTHTFTFSPAVTCAASIHSSRAGELGQVDLLSVRTRNWSDLTGHAPCRTATSLFWNGLNFVCSAFIILPSATVERSQTKSHRRCGCEHHHPFISGPALMLDLKLANIETWGGWLQPRQQRAHSSIYNRVTGWQLMLPLSCSRTDNAVKCSKR